MLTFFLRRSLNSFLSPTEAAADSSLRNADPMQLDPSTQGGMDTNAFFGFPMGAEITEDWCVFFSLSLSLAEREPIISRRATYLPQAFFSPDPTGAQSSMSPEGDPMNHPS